MSTDRRRRVRRIRNWVTGSSVALFLAIFAGLQTQGSSQATTTSVASTSQSTQTVAPVTTQQS
jgi:hypothetical protein